MPAEQAAALVSIAERAAFGRGEATIVDETVRKAMANIERRIAVHFCGCSPMYSVFLCQLCMRSLSCFLIFDLPPLLI